MSKVKSGGSARQHSTRPGKRLGIKLYGGQAIKTGQIIVRQRGNTYHAGMGVGTGSDHTLFALKDGTIQFKTNRGKKVICVA